MPLSAPAQTSSPAPASHVRPAATARLAAVHAPLPRLHRNPAMYLAEPPLAPHRHRAAATSFRCAPPSRNKPSAPPVAHATSPSHATTSPSHSVRAPAVAASVGAAHDPNPNFRRSMEDASVTHVCDALPAAFVAVYDGHGGSTVAHYLRQLLHGLFLDELLVPTAKPPSTPRSPASPALAAQARTLDDDDAASSPGSISSCDDDDTPPLDAPAAFRRAFRRMDRMLAERRCLRVGATAVAAFLSRRAHGDRVLTVANCGDARAVLSRGGRAVRLSDDHRPTGAERARIEQAGGFVCGGRVNGVLNVARAFGDHSMKGLVVSTPSVVELRVGPIDDFVVLACDGLWDVMDDASVVRAAQLAFDKGLSPNAVARELVRLAIERRSTDNVSVTVLQLHPDDEE